MKCLRCNSELREIERVNYMHLGFSEGRGLTLSESNYHINRVYRCPNCGYTEFYSEIGGNK